MTQGEEVNNIDPTLLSLSGEKGVLRIRVGHTILSARYRNETTKFSLLKRKLSNLFFSTTFTVEYAQNNVSYHYKKNLNLSVSLILSRLEDMITAIKA